ncbi:MAG TPA: hypothetical protein VGV89_00070 [Thermoplasmata archaeon]|nr:hypothetical protein [Thermoplasmata archaeon]
MVVAALVIVAIVVAALFYLGIHSSPSTAGKAPPSHGPPPVPGASFQDAYAAANASAQSGGSGPWGLVSATGLAMPANATLPVANSSSSPACHLASPIQVPGTPMSDRDQGRATFWGFTFEDASGNNFLDISVIGGKAAIASSFLASANCLGRGPIGTLPPSSEVMDSAALVTTLQNLTPFLFSYPNATIELDLSDEPGATGRVSGTAFWLLGAEPCASPVDPFALVEPGDPGYLGAVNATGHAVLLDRFSWGFGQCELPGTLGANLTLSPVSQESTDGQWQYLLSVTAAGGAVTPSSFQPRVFSALPPVGLWVGGPSNPAALAVDLEVLGTTSAQVANYSYSTDSWTTGGSVPLVAGDKLVLQVSGPLPPASLVLVATPPMSGQIGVWLN